MGIQGLLPALRSISESIHIKMFANKKVGIDGYSWLHKGAFGCALELCTGTPTTRYIDYFIERIKMLLYNRVIPIVIFDGARLPAKDETDSLRRDTRWLYLDRGQTLLKEGKLTHATECFQKAVNITPFMAHQVAQALMEMGVQVLVAPYEADAQLAWLCFQKEIEAVITEDSDLIAYGVSRIIYKMCRSGEGFLISRKNLGAVEGLPLAMFTQDMLQLMSIISGCDFFPGIHGLGIKKAHGFVKRYRTLERVFWVLKNNPKFQVQDSDFDKMLKALLTFKHQRVYDHRNGKLVFLTDLNVHDPLVASILKSDSSLSFLGPLIPDSIVRGIAEGKLHPSTWESFPIVEKTEQAYKEEEKENLPLVSNTSNEKERKESTKTMRCSPLHDICVPNPVTMKKKMKRTSWLTSPQRNGKLISEIRLFDFFQKPRASKSLSSIISTKILHGIKGKRPREENSKQLENSHLHTKKPIRQSDKDVLTESQNLVEPANHNNLQPTLNFIEKFRYDQFERHSLRAYSRMFFRCLVFLRSQQEQAKDNATDWNTLKTDDQPKQGRTRNKHLFPRLAVDPEQYKKLSEIAEKEGLFGKVGVTSVSYIPPDQRKYDAVLFDMDGVLCDSEILSRLAAAEMFAECYHVKVKPEQFAAFTGCGEEKFLSGVAELYQIPNFNPSAAKKQFFDIYLSRYTLSGKLKTFPGVKDLISTCKKVGLKVAVASSADRIKVSANLLGIGLDEQIFDYITESDCIPRKKPFPDIFLSCAEGLRVDNKRCVVIEDAPAGIQAAKAAGMRCIAVTTSLKEEELRALKPDVIRQHPGVITVADILAFDEETNGNN
eukprot:jgi/Galph1/3559/GphlegSOOS_G2195.1